MTLLAKAAPNSWADAGIRVVKTFVSGAASGATVASFTSASGLEGMLFAGGTAAFSLVLNTILKWANS